MSVKWLRGWWVVILDRGGQVESRHVTERSARSRDKVMNSRRVVDTGLYAGTLASGVGGGSGPVADYLLQEDGFLLLTESGEMIQL